MNGIVISPIDVNAMAPALQTAIDNGVPVVTIDRRVAGVNGITAHVGADNVKGGEAQGEWVLANYPERRQRSSTCRVSRAPRRRSTATRACTTSSTPHKDKYKFVAEQTANFARDQGLSVTESLLAGMTTPPDVIVAANDDMALGAIEAVKAQAASPTRSRSSASTRCPRRWARSATARSPARSSSSRAARAARPCRSWSSC